MRAASVRPFVSALLVLAAGCGIDFESPSEVLDLRTLAVRTSPPEVLLGELPDSVAVDALVVDPRDPEREVAVRWRACGSTDDHRCDEAAVVQDLDDGTARLPALHADLTLTPELVEGARRADLLMGFGGFPIYVELTVEPGGSDEEVSFKEIVAQVALPAGTVANANPSEPGLLRDDEPWPADEVAVVAPGDEIAVEPTALDQDAEQYSVFRFDLQTEDLVEHLGYRFFSTEGSWNREQTGGPPDPIATETTLASRWTAPDQRTEEGQPVRLWVVVRDGRGGTAWAERQVEVR